jgi:hypothetical protein
MEMKDSLELERWERLARILGGMRRWLESREGIFVPVVGRPDSENEESQ